MTTPTYRILALAVCAGAIACDPPRTPEAAVPTRAAGAVVDLRAERTLETWRHQLDTLAVRATQLDSALIALDGEAGVAPARAAFVAARRAFKHVEVGLEYYAPSTARSMNGPALPEVEETEGPEAVFPPTGFQVIEELLYGDDPVGTVESLRRESATLRQLVTRARTMMGAPQATDDRVWDAAKLEIARVVTLGLAGFDSPVAGHALPEAEAALEGVARALAPYRTDAGAWVALEAAMAGARAALRAGTDRASFDHLAFIVEHANPLARTLWDARLALGIGTPVERRAFRMEAAALFDSAAFDVMAFAPIDAEAPTAEAIALGRRLFHDARLSGDGRRACSSCHLPERAFTDGLRVNRTRGGSPLARNTPTVINSGLQLGLFADLRTTYLEDQVTDVVENVDEMHGSLDASARTLAGDTAVVRWFRAAYPSAGVSVDSLLTAARIRAALAAYQRSLTRMDSPADRALRGDVAALTPEQHRGFNVFVGKGKCATCHFLPLTTGTIPPMYQKSEVEVLGTPSRAVTRGATVDPDEGRHRLTRAAPHRHAFRTPSLRNVALTAPYMHNGAYPTLASVIDFYDRGGGAGIGVRLENQTLPPDRLDLTAAERRDLEAFLRALTDTVGTMRR